MSEKLAAQENLTEGAAALEVGFATAGACADASQLTPALCTRSQKMIKHQRGRAGQAGWC